jgi:biofilm PGA synthesis N-glycosyltransferase PgaC
MVHFSSSEICDPSHNPRPSQEMPTPILSILILLVLAGTATYVLFLASLCVGLLRLGKPSGGARPAVTVVVPMHDEAAVIARTLEALSLQRYEGRWEVVCVDDRSTDSTSSIVAGKIAVDPRFRMVRVDPSEPVVASPKKRALARGFAAAQGEILMTTDADCQPPPHWIETLAGCFRDGVDIVQGPKHCLGDGRACHRYQRLEMLALVGAEAAGFGLGRPFLASAPSLAYRSELYRRSGGFDGLEDLVSGDDDMLVQRMVRSGGKAVYALDPSASVGTFPADTWLQAINQRARWASNGVRYESKAYVALLIALFSWWCWILVGWIPWSAGIVPGWTWWGIWTAKIPADLLFLALSAWKLDRRKPLLDYPWCLPVQVAISAVCAVLGQLGWFRWTRGPSANPSAG